MDTDWQARVKGLLEAELKRRNVSYKELVDKLASLGIRETEQNIRTKISRGGFHGCVLYPMSGGNWRQRFANP